MQTRSNGSIVENTNFCPAGLGMFDIKMNINQRFQFSKEPNKGKLVKA